MGGDLTFDVAVDPFRNIIYAADQFAAVDVIDGKTNTVTATINLPGQPTGLVVDLGNRNVYVNNVNLNAAQVINGNTRQLTATVPVGSAPEYSDIDSFRGLDYVGNSGDNTVSVVSTH